MALELPGAKTFVGFFSLCDRRGAGESTGLSDMVVASRQDGCAKHKVHLKEINNRKQPFIKTNVTQGRARRCGDASMIGSPKLCSVQSLFP